MAFDYDKLRECIKEIKRDLPSPDDPTLSVQVRVQLLTMDPGTDLSIEGLKIISERGNDEEGIEVLKGLMGTVASVMENWAQQFADPDDARSVMMASLGNRLSGGAKAIYTSSIPVPEKEN